MIDNVDLQSEENNSSMKPVEDKLLGKESINRNVNAIEPNNKLTVMEKAAIKNLFEEHFNSTFAVDPDAKKRLITLIKKEVPEITETQLNKLYRKQEHNHYQQLKRMPAEAMVNKLTEQNDYLKDRILNESTVDITKQTKAINELDKLTADINKLRDAPVKIEVNFHQEIPVSDLINNDVIDVTPNTKE